MPAARTRATTRTAPVDAGRPSVEALGRILRQVVERRLHAELGFRSFARYVEERLDLAARTARRLTRLARAEHSAPAVANAFRSGRLTAMQAEALLRLPSPDESRVARAQGVTLRRLEECVAEPVAFQAPRDVAALFLDVLARAGSLERLLTHVIRTWVREGQHFRDHRTLERYGSGDVRRRP